ncbi:MAG: indolepyruvate oxidoreductase subunit beta [Firmicutes bacterium]|nr:indolepyruvate oxidoreductase subunit beta [Bacillota bacterium]
MNKIDILITGVGGQGTILAGKILGQLALNANLDVKMAETHGMAQRGGSVITHVRLGEKVYSPLIPLGAADFLLSFEQLETMRWLPYLRRGGTIIYHTRSLAPLPVLCKQMSYPAHIPEQLDALEVQVIPVTGENTPVEKNPRVLNITLLGVLSKHLPFKQEQWLEALENTVPPKFLDLNKEAFLAGQSL